MSVVPANLAAELHPGPPTEYVTAAFYGGPRDGLITPVIETAGKRILGTCHAPGFTGAYTLSGFFRAGNFDYAVYEWNGARR